MDNIAPGSRISVKIIKHPRSAAATKTLVRLLSKDSVAKHHNERLRKARKNGFRQNRRGGRFWDVQVVKQHPVATTVGSAGTITASLDVLTDLKSVERYVEVTKA